MTTLISASTHPSAPASLPASRPPSRGRGEGAPIQATQAPIDLARWDQDWKLRETGRGAREFVVSRTAGRAPTLDEAMIEASLWGESSVVKSLLESGANPLAIASIHVDVEAARAGRGQSDPGNMVRGSRMLSSVNLTALMAASLEGWSDIVELLAPISDPHVVADEERLGSALGLAALGGHAKCVELLLAVGARPETHSDERGGGPDALSSAALQGAALCAALIWRALSPGRKAILGREAISWVFHKGAMEHVQLLLDLGVEAPARGSELIIQAAKRGDLGLLGLAIGWCPNDVATPNKQGRTALMAASDCPPALAMLLPGSDPRAADAKGFTALMAAAMAGSIECAQALLPLSDPLARDVDGSTALRWAAGQGGACVESLLGFGGLDWKGQDGLTPLATAASYGNFALALRLEAAGSDPRVRDDEGNSVLHHAAINGSSELIERVLSRCDPDELNDNGSTALMLAIHHGQWDCALALAKATTPGIKNREGHAPRAWAKICWDYSEGEGGEDFSAAIGALEDAWELSRQTPQAPPKPASRL